MKVYGWEGQAVEEVSIEFHWESLIRFFVDCLFHIGGVFVCMH